jgi:hypothetical protein
MISRDLHISAALCCCGLLLSLTGCTPEEPVAPVESAVAEAAAPESRAGGITCSEVRAQLAAFLDGELEIDVRARIGDHLQACEACMMETTKAMD